jgi:hypothetical protein
MMERYASTSSGSVIFSHLAGLANTGLPISTVLYPLRVGERHNITLDKIAKIFWGCNHPDVRGAVRSNKQQTIVLSVHARGCHASPSTEPFFVPFIGVNFFPLGDTTSASIPTLNFGILALSRDLN